MSDDALQSSPEVHAEEQRVRASNVAFASAAAQEEQQRRIREDAQLQAQQDIEAIEERIRQSQLADAQEDGERSLRTTTDRFARDLDDLESLRERVRALADAKRTMQLEQDDADIERQVEREDTIDQERHERHASVQLAISLAETERLRRMGESERDQLENLSVELSERHANQRAAGRAVEEERRRRVLENPLGSPFARPGDHHEYTDDQLDDLNRQAASLLADHLSQEEKARRVQESLDDDLLASAEENLDRRLAQRNVKLLTEDERARRLLEAESNELEESKYRRHSVALAKHQAEAEQNERISREQAETSETTFENERDRRENQLKAIELTERERQSQIETSTHIRRPSALSGN